MMPLLSLQRKIHIILQTLKHQQENYWQDLSYFLELAGSLDILIIQSVITSQAHLIFNCICLHQQ